ncbi:MAG: MrpF/PhaF family protein [Chloroflexota bacterium]|jgi:multisubunit Na+/H+ antiporter MnhF subunit
MTDFLTITLYLSLLIHVVLIAVTTWFVGRSENVINRLLSLELLGTLILAVLILIAIINNERIYIDVALGLAAMGFVGMVAVARYIADQQMF